MRRALKDIAFGVVTLFLASILQPNSFIGQNVNTTPQGPFKIDAVTGVKNLLVKPELAYQPKRYNSTLRAKLNLK